MLSGTQLAFPKILVIGRSKGKFKHAEAITLLIIITAMMPLTYGKSQS